MSKRIIYIVVLCLSVLLIQSCNNFDFTKWFVTLDKDSKKPYGGYLAYQSLQSFFPEAKVSGLSNSFRFTSIDRSMMSTSGTRNLIVLTGLRFNVSDKEWAQMMSFVKEGNELVIFSSSLDKDIESKLGVYKTQGREEQVVLSQKVFAESQHVLTLAGDTVKKYGYSGRSINSFFESSADYYLHNVPVDTTTVKDSVTLAEDSTAVIDSDEYYQADTDQYTIADTLGYASGKPNFLRIAIGRGHLTLHAAPLVTSNYFLLQDGNINYLAAIWSTLPADISHIYWDDYFNHSSEETSSNVLWRYESTRWGILLAFFVAGVYVLFQMKRRQRIVQVIAPLKNDSVSFVETVGRLYYNTGNNANLADKMVQQFLEWVRMTCYLNTSTLNEDFIRELSAKTGQSPAVTAEIVNMIHEVRLGSVPIDDPYLYQLYRTIQQFYKNHSR